MANVAKKPVPVTLSVGDKAPLFDLPTDGSGNVSIAKLKGQNIVVYFYPRDDTPGCTLEAQDFKKNMPKFEKANTTIIGVSKDDEKSHAKFKEKYCLPFTLASDNKDACEQYGVWVEKSMYGKKYMGIERTTFLIDAKGIIRNIWSKVKVDGHVDEVLAAVKAL